VTAPEGPDPALRRLLRWYPRAWRERYGDEFLATVEDISGGGPPTARLRLSVADRLNASGLYLLGLAATGLLLAVTFGLWTRVATSTARQLGLSCRIPGRGEGAGRGRRGGGIRRAVRQLVL
jgi:hypothetical protein